MRDKRKRTEAQRIFAKAREAIGILGPAHLMAKPNVSPEDVALHFVELLELGIERPMAWVMVCRFVESFCEEPDDETV